MSIFLHVLVDTIYAHKYEEEDKRQPGKVKIGNVHVPLVYVAEALGEVGYKSGRSMLKTLAGAGITAIHPEGKYVKATSKFVNDNRALMGALSVAGGVALANYLDDKLNKNESEN
jgi:hypothetical protein